jgi:hypothetical protein
MVVSEAARNLAYAELVAGLLDVRDTAAEAEFDATLAAAEAAGRIDSQTARALRWWQRETVRNVVSHAQVVLPPTLLALEQSLRESHQRVESPPDVTVDDPDDAVEEPADEPPRQPTDLMARRLLVAGLTPLRDP